MDNDNPLLVGLDVGTTKICALVGENDEFFKVNPRPLAIMASVPRPDPCQLFRK